MKSRENRPGQVIISFYDLVWDGGEQKKKEKREDQMRWKSMDYMFGRRNLEKSKSNVPSLFCPHSCNFSFKYDDQIEMLKMLGYKKKLSTDYQKHFV